MQRTDRVISPSVEIVTILEANRANDAAPADSAADGIKSLIEGIIRPVLRKTNGVEEGHHGPGFSDQLLELDVALRVRFRAELLSSCVQRGGFAILVSITSAYKIK